jgi:hypothetical protein
VVVAGTYRPFAESPTLPLLQSLGAALSARGCEVDRVLLPFTSEDEACLDALLGLRCLDVSEAGGSPVDCLIAVGLAASALVHPHKRVWLTADAARVQPARADDAAGRRHPGHWERLFLGEARKVFAASEALARSVWDAAAREVAGVVVPPLQSDLVRTPTHPAREAFVCHVRESSPQMPALLEAMSRSTAACRFDIVVEGRADGVADLVAQVNGRGHLAGRVQVVRGASRQRQADLIAEARALVYTPGGSVACDWPILAAFHARTPVVVLQGAGAPLDLVRHGQNGLVVEPRSQPLAEVLDTLWRDEAQAAHLGEAGYETLETRGLSWEAAAAALLA